MTPTVGIVIVAAGSGARLAAPQPKAFASLLGTTILERAIVGALGSREPAHIVVVAPASHLPQAREIADRIAPHYVTVVVGGDTRQRSVAAGLAALDPRIGTVLVHDAARALTPSALFDRVVRAVQGSNGGVIPALPVSDTIKRVDETDVVVDTVDRSDLVHVQTPQGFPRAALDAAYAAATTEYTDDAALFAAAGNEVSVVEGEARAFKITTPWDLRRAESLLSQGSTVRTGIGIDVHAYDAGRPLWLGGIYWPDEVGLAGHSDADAISHAICDALLSAAGLGDIGGRFGTDNPAFADAHGDVFIRSTLAAIAGAGFSVGNVAVQVVAKHPKMGPRRHEMERTLSQLVGAPVSVSATTSDGLGFTGRAEGVAAIATALLTR
jgi:2-C-methyl-D-erythritol 4-phosphate cytidylyltransferase/2-C-methyl-D-erythritol 2,4-cyclodiphosphate synthase